MFSITLTHGSSWARVVLVMTFAVGGFALAPAQDSTPQSADASTTTSEVVSEEDDWENIPREERRARMRQRSLMRYEADGKGKFERMDHYVKTFRESVVYDPRLYLFNVEAKLVDGTTGTLELKGDVTLQQYRDSFTSTLENLGFKISENNIKVLPDESLGTQRFAASTTAAATMRKEPRDRSEQINSVAHGGWVRLLREARPEDVASTPAWSRRGSRGRTEEPTSVDGWFLAQTLEGYIGFMRESDLKRSDKIRQPDGMLEAPVEVSGTSAETSVGAGAFVFESGKGYELITGQPVPQDARITRFSQPVSEQDITQLMKPFDGTRYVWGGVTDGGVDCSGFTQFFARSRGVYIPRDAEQQATVGQIIAWGRDVEAEAKPGDLIFFANDSGRISHVGISIGGGRMIHSGSGVGVHIVKLSDPREDDGETYLDKTMFARRVIMR